MAEGSYTGLVCYVSPNVEAHDADGNLCEGGWHYSVKRTENGDYPDRKLNLDPKSGEYSFASESDKSWHEKHHKRLVIIAPEGNVGFPHDAESVEATLRHLDQHEERIGALDPHEDGHMLSSPQEVAATRRWLKANPNGVRP